MQKNNPLSFEALYERAWDESEIVYLEIRNPRPGTYQGWAVPKVLRFHTPEKEITGEIVFEVFGDEIEWLFGATDYGRTWRVWPCRPDETEKAAHAWEK